jgi:VIT1/CCC1 family predicted Fe2+/Mn2+ transporter
MAEVTNGYERTSDDRSVGELVQQLSQQTSTLIRQELRLATAELQEKGKHAGIGALVAAAIIGLGTVMEPWLAAVIVGVVLLAVAGVVALIGRKQVQEAAPPMPEQTVASVQRDIDTVKGSAQR